MQLINQFQSEWMHELIDHASQLDLMQCRMAPLEIELDTLYAKIDKHVEDTPDWGDCVIAPILLGIKDSYIVQDLEDRTVLQWPVMLVTPRREGREPVSFVVLFRLTDRVTGDFTVTITGYTVEHGMVEEVLHSGNSLTVEMILKKIDAVRDRL